MTIKELIEKDKLITGCNNYGDTETELIDKIFNLI